METYCLEKVLLAPSWTGEAGDESLLLSLKCFVAKRMCELLLLLLLL